MSCLAICIQPSPSNAHCAACHVTFGSVSGFDRHRRGGECLAPAGLGFVRDRKGVWRFAAPDPTAHAVWPQRAGTALADHPHADPGDGRTECDVCGKWVFQVTHSCKRVPVTQAAWLRHRARAAADALAAEKSEEIS